jgi:hypothetical protein
MITKANSNVKVASSIVRALLKEYQQIKGVAFAAKLE